MPARSAAELAAIALEVAEEAAALVLSGWRTRPTFEKKGQKDLVSEFDLASERLVRARLAELTPEIPVIGEEAVAAQGGHVRDRGRFWLADPIDGTTNYVHGHFVWAVSLGLVEDGVPVGGAVVAPTLHTRWHGAVGVGAFRNGVPCRVSGTRELHDALVATGFPYDRRDEAPHNNFDSFIRVKKAVRAVRRCGSASIDLCLTADGTYDAYFERHLKPWDMAAGAGLLVAAGGRWSAFDGGAYDYDSGCLLASNGLIHEALSPHILG